MLIFYKYLRFEEGRVGRDTRSHFSCLVGFWEAGLFFKDEVGWLHMWVIINEETKDQWAPFHSNRLFIYFKNHDTAFLFYFQVKFILGGNQRKKNQVPKKIFLRVLIDLRAFEQDSKLKSAFLHAAQPTPQPQEGTFISTDLHTKGHYSAPCSH